MTTPATPAEQLLLLGADFTRHNDTLARLRLNDSSSATALTHQAAATQHLARSALDIAETLNAQRMYRSPVVRAVYARVRQFAHLATDAADHLLNAVNVLNNARATVSVQDEDALPAYRHALGEAGNHLALVRDLTTLGAQDALTAAEQFVTEQRRSSVPPPHPPPALSSTQDAALRATARGEVTIDRLSDKPYVSRDDIRIAISTIRSLESRGLVTREPCPLLLHDERVHLTADGRRSLAATFGHPRTPTRATARPALKGTQRHRRPIPLTSTPAPLWETSRPPTHPPRMTSPSHWPPRSIRTLRPAT
ncbi:hypothetical protein [Streptomyces sp. PSAA01]|uniref:hypothetical protein n=1 Tax=Streptomyces sp. PSAA01 TaxID=2912762 RepID=UPI001F21990C|nr:hypothetical protein [Streptomyces sp. PSAA01]MCG0285438.1 hypothetical protein [Streptomyces sp. PSAA01]